MKAPLTSLAAAALIAFMSSTAVHAENSQQDKMKTCNAQAGEKKLTGDDRKSFMKTCLSSSPAAETKTLTPQQQKMKSCNADATQKGLKGDDRKSFMKTCLSGK